MNRIIVSLLLISSCCMAQIPDSTEVNGEKIASELLKEITLTPLKLSQKEHFAYYRLRRKVHKVYPYAVRAKKQLQEIEEDFLYLETKRQKKKIAKLHSRWVQEHFTEDLKKLTRSEGRILTKLIYLETGITSFDLIKKYRNGFTAALWQRLAKFYDGDLKSGFNPETIKEDKWIEHILWRMKYNNKLKTKQ